MKLFVDPNCGRSSEFPVGLRDVESRALIGCYASVAEASYVKTLYEANIHDWSDDDDPDGGDDEDLPDDDDEDLPADMVEPDDDDNEYGCEARSWDAQLINAHGDAVAEVLQRMLAMPRLTDADRTRLEQLSRATMSARAHHHPVRAHEEVKAALAEAETIAERYGDGRGPTSF